MLKSVADPGGRGDMACKNSHKKDGRCPRRLIFHVSCPLSKVSGSAAENVHS